MALRTRPGSAFALALGLSAAVVLAHLPVLHSRAIALDDSLLVFDNALVLHPSSESVQRFFAEALKPSTASYYMPLSMTSLMLDVAGGGSEEHLEPFHVTSLALHGLATLFLFLMLRSLFGCGVPAALAALAYGVHPVMVESIASAGERKTVLASAMAFASVWAYVGHAKEGGRAWRWISVALFALALLAKPSPLALPLALVLLDVWPLRRFSRTALLEKWPYALAALISAAISVVAVQRSWEMSSPSPFDYMGLGFRFVWLLKIAWLPAFYLGKVAWPADLSPMYAPPGPFAFSNPVVLLGIAVTAVVSIAAWLLRRRLPGLLLAWTILIVLLAPTFGLVTWSKVIAYDRFLHLPALGLAIGVAAGLTAQWRRWNEASRRAVLVLAVLAVVGVEIVGTRRALAHWRDSLVFWRHTVLVSPTMSAAHNGLGVVHSNRNDREAAIAEFRRAVVADRHNAEAHLNLARELMRRGSYDEALPHLELAASTFRANPEVAVMLGVAMERIGRLPEAEAEFRRALTLRPGDVDAMSLLGRLLLADGRSEQGLALLRHIIERDPNSVPALNALAWLRATSSNAALRDTTEALLMSERAMRIDASPNPHLLDTRAAALAAAGRFPEAIAAAEAAVRLARELRDDTLAARAAERLAGYRRGQAYVAPAHPHR